MPGSSGSANRSSASRASCTLARSRRKAAKLTTWCAIRFGRPLSGCSGDRVVAARYQAAPRSDTSEPIARMVSGGSSRRPIQRCRGRECLLGACGRAASPKRLEMRVPSACGTNRFHSGHVYKKRGGRSSVFCPHRDHRSGAHAVPLCSPRRCAGESLSDPHTATKSRRVRCRCRRFRLVNGGVVRVRDVETAQGGEQG